MNGMKQSDPNAYAEVWIINSDGSGEMSTGVQCAGVGGAPRWQPRPNQKRTRAANLLAGFALSPP